MSAIRAGGRGDITETHRAWAFDKGPDVPTPVTDGKHFYVVDDKGERVGVLLDLVADAVATGAAVT